MEKKKRATIAVVIFAVLIFIFGITAENDIDNMKNNITSKFYNNSDTFRIISSSENKDLEGIMQNYATKNDIDLEIEYAGTIDIMDKLNSGEKYDAVWTSNSIWLYMLDSKVKTSNSKSTSIDPVVFGVKKSKAKELGFIGKDVYMKDILSAIKNNKLKFSMSSAT